MEEQFILRVPPSVAERIERLLNEDPSSSEDNSLDLSFSEDGRSGTFAIGNDSFPASLFDLPTITESYKSYDDSVLIKTADIGQMILVREGGDSKPDMVEYRHGLTPPMRDARRRRFRREPDLNPEVVQRVENDLLNIMQSRGPTQGCDHFDMVQMDGFSECSKCDQCGDLAGYENDGMADGENYGDLGDELKTDGAASCLVCHLCTGRLSADKFADCTNCYQCVAEAGGVNDSYGDYGNGVGGGHSFIM